MRKRETTMGKKVLQKITMMTGLCLLLMLMQTKVFAAGTVNVTVDKVAANLDDTLTVTVTTSEPEDAATPPQISVTYDTEKLSFVTCDVEYGGGGGGLITITGTQAQIQFTAIGEGATTVAAEAIIDEDGNNPAIGQANLSIGSGQADATQEEESEESTEGEGTGSADAALKALVVKPGTMVPDFDPDVTEYTIYVKEDVTDVKISGGVRDENATITAASGFKNLESGSNDAIITVTAENGESLTYRFTIQRGGEIPAEADEEEKNTAFDDEQDTAEKGEDTKDKEETGLKAGTMEIKIGEQVYAISSTVEDSLIPLGFTKNSIDYYGNAIEGAFFEAASVQLLYAISEQDKSGEFFVYDTENACFSLFAQMRGMDGRFIIPIPTKAKVPAGFEKEDLFWNSASVEAYMLKKKSVKNAEVFYLLYAVNQDGEEDFYLYDDENETYQRFLNVAGTSSQGLSLSGNGILIIACLGICLVGCIIAIVLLAVRNKELNDDIEILAQARERRRVETPKKPAAKKQVIIPDQAEDSSEKIDIASPYKGEAKKKQNAPRTLEPDVETAIPPMAQLAKDNMAAAKPQEEKKQAKAFPIMDEKEEQNAPKPVSEEASESDILPVSNVELAMDDLSDVADLLNNEENMEFTKMLASFSTGRVNVVTPQTRPQARAQAKPQARSVETPSLREARKESNKQEEELIQKTETEGAKQNSIPVVNVERKSVSLTREALPDEPDDDFEFEFINLDD